MDTENIEQEEEEEAMGLLGTAPFHHGVGAVYYNRAVGEQYIVVARDAEALATLLARLHGTANYNSSQSHYVAVTPCPSFTPDFGGLERGAA